LKTHATNLVDLIDICEAVIDDKQVYFSYAIFVWVLHELFEHLRELLELFSAYFFLSDLHYVMVESMPQRNNIMIITHYCNIILNWFYFDDFSQYI
jgi:hypothetical protein